MLIAFTCLNCGKDFQKDSSLAGKKGRCSQCGHVFEIPGLSGRVPAGSAKKSIESRSSGNASSVSSSRASGSSSSGRELAGPRTATSSPPGGIDDDPYGFDDVPTAPKPTASSREDDLILPRRDVTEIPGPRPAPGIRQRSRRRPEGFFSGLPSFVYYGTAAVLVSGYLLSLVILSVGACVFLGGAIISFFIFFLYGAAGLIIIPFNDSFWSGLLCWICPPYLLGYTWRRWDEMRGPFLSMLASYGVIIVLAIAMPGMGVLNRGNATVGSPRMAASAPGQPAGIPPELAAHGFRPPPMLGPALPPPGVQPPVMTSSITLTVSGIKDHAAGDAFNKKLNELVDRVADGHQISGSGSGGKSTVSISMKNTMSVQAFADQITWARVTRVSGQTIEIDASAVTAE
jgi:hypothetical protein